MDLFIESTASLSNSTFQYSSEESFMIVPSQTLIKVDFRDKLLEEEFSDELDEDKFIKQVGHIYTHTFNLDYSKNELATLADIYNQDLSYISSFFFHEEGKENLSFRYLFHIDEVFIEPEHRGYGYGIKALAMFLQHFAWGETVCCHPHPIRDLMKKYKYSAEKGELLLKKYWSKVGLEKYNKERNILWTDEWSMPNWLWKQIFAGED